MTGISPLNNGYGNYSAYNDDFLAQQMLNNKAVKDSLLNSNANLNLVNDTVSFAGKTDEEKDKSNTTTTLIASGVAIGAFLVGKNWKAIKGLLKGLIKAKTPAKTKTPLDKAKTKNWDTISKNKKQKIKGTSVTGASAPVTNTQEAKIIQNIDTKHASNNSRRLVEQHMDDVVTPEMQAAYDRNIAYRPLKPNQQKAKAALDAKNAAQRAELNSVANNSKGAEKLKTVAQAAQKTENLTAVIKDGAHINPANKNIYFTKDGVVTQIRTATPNSKGEYTITDPLKIAKHLEKNNINLSEFAAKNTAQAA